MSVLVTLDVQAKPESLGELVSALKGILPDTRAYEGCQGIDIYANQDDPHNMIFVEHWDSREQYEKYLSWRTETGVMDQLGALLAGPPTFKYFDRVDV